MKIISFAWTVQALLSGRKTCTRRDWTDHHAMQFNLGDLVAAYDRTPRNHGKRIGVVKLTAQPAKLPLSLMPAEDYEAEGYAFMYEHPEFLPKTLWGKKCTRWDVSAEAFARWRDSGVSLWVIRFELVDPLPGVVTRLRRPDEQPVLPGLVGDFGHRAWEADR